MNREDANDFYEEDEPVEKIWEAFRRGVKGVTSKVPEAHVRIMAEDEIIEERERDDDETEAMLRQQQEASSLGHKRPKKSATENRASDADCPDA